MAKKIAKAPVEWVDGKIVLVAPADPISGRGNKRLARNDLQFYLGFEVSRPLFQWYYNLLDEMHKTKAWDERSKVSYISPEAAKLLKKNVDFFEDKFKEGKKSLGKKKKQELKMAEGNFETPPEWVGEKIVLPKPAESPNKKYYWKPNFDGENYKAVLWFRDHLPESHQGQITDPNNGYPAKTMSTEAGELWFKHKGFWLAQYYIPIKEKEAQKKELVSVEREPVNVTPKKASTGFSEVLPSEWVGGKIVLSDPAQSPEKKFYWRPHFREENYTAVLWFRDQLPEMHQGEIINPYGFPAKTMSIEAGKLWFKHKEFWLGQYFLPKKKKESQRKEMESAVRKTLNNISIKEGILIKELNQKLKKLSILAKGEDVSLAIRMVSDFDDAWLFELLLAGGTINEEGYLIPGKPLKMFKDHAEFFGILALANAPDSVCLPASLNKTKLRYFNINLCNIQLFGKHISPKLPDLKSNGELRFYVHTILSAASAKALSTYKGDLALYNLGHLDIAAARALAKHQGGLGILFGFNGSGSLDDDTAEALSKHKGYLILYGLESLSDTAAIALSKHKGKMYLDELTILSDSAKKALAKKSQRKYDFMALPEPIQKQLDKYRAHSKAKVFL
jgi:hypothetical protein